MGPASVHRSPIPPPTPTVPLIPFICAVCGGGNGSCFCSPQSYSSSSPDTLFNTVYLFSVRRWKRVLLLLPVLLLLLLLRLSL
jgi:hypothetical protein